MIELDWLNRPTIFLFLVVVVVSVDQQSFLFDCSFVFVDRHFSHQISIQLIRDHRSSFEPVLFRMFFCVGLVVLLIVVFLLVDEQQKKVQSIHQKIIFVNQLDEVMHLEIDEQFLFDSLLNASAVREDKLLIDMRTNVDRKIAT